MSRIQQRMALFPTFSGVGPSEEEFIIVYAEMIQISASLQDFSQKRDRIGVAVAHSFKDLDFVIEPFDGGRGKP